MLVGVAFWCFRGGLGLIKLYEIVMRVAIVGHKIVTVTIVKFQFNLVWIN